MRIIDKHPLSVSVGEATHSYFVPPFVQEAFYCSTPCQTDVH